jgi:NADPH-dependent curcumin reductase
MGRARTVAAPRGWASPHRTLGQRVAFRPPNNTQLRLAARPTGLPGPECWSVTVEPAEFPAAGEVLVEVAYISLDPGLRGWIAESDSYVAPVAVGAVMRAFGVGRVLQSASESITVGSIVTGLLGVQQYSRLAADGLTTHPDAHNLPRLLGALGISGITAYLGLLDVAAITHGDTVVISAAAGSVGSIAGQIARIHGCRVIGIAGGARKCAWLVDELGFDAAIDYKSEDVGLALERIAPSGVDVYLDNVGGELLERVLDRIAVGARIVLSGTVSQWESGDWPGLRNHRVLLVRRARMQGFLVFDHPERYDAARQSISEWIAQGELIAREEIVPGGVGAFPDALRSLLSGDNMGKLVVEVAGG